MKKKAVSVKKGIFKGASPLNRGILKGVSPLSLFATRSALGLPVAKKREVKPFNYPRRLPSALVRVERSWQPKPTISITKHIKICKDRQKRKEVLFANKNAGRGVAIHTPKKLTENSKVRC